MTDQTPPAPTVIVTVQHDSDIDVQSPLSLFDTLAALQLALYKVSAVHYNFVAAQRQQEAQKKPQLLIPTSDPRMVKQRG